jgi:hypothetical protein
MIGTGRAQQKEASRLQWQLRGCAVIQAAA